MRSLLSICLLGVSLGAYAHGGGLDSSGCHTKHLITHNFAVRHDIEASDASASATPPERPDLSYRAAWRTLPHGQWAKTLRLLTIFGF
jgi:hypothetical protein